MSEEHILELARTHTNTMQIKIGIDSRDKNALQQKDFKNSLAALLARGQPQKKPAVV